MKKTEIIPAAANPRKVALEIVYRICEKGAYANIALEQTLRRSPLSSGDKRLVTELVNGSVKMLKHLDWVLNLFLSRPQEKQNPWLRNILRISLYQILFMSKIPEYACVNDAVNLSRQKLGAKLATVTNGVLRSILRQKDNIIYPTKPVEYLSVYYSQPQWLVDKLLGVYGVDNTAAMLSYFNQKPAVVLRNNILKGSREELLLLLGQEGVGARPSNLVPSAVLIDSLDRSIEDLRAFREGRFYIQNEAAMLAIPILEPAAGEMVFDLCAGLGGKSTHIAEKMSNKGCVRAYELYQHKLSLLAQNCLRLGITIVEGCQADVLELPAGITTAQRVLLDAPCSGLGVLNRRADSRWRKDPSILTALQKLQVQLIKKAGELVSPGGVLVYSTCTINREENEDIVKLFLDNNSQFSLEDFTRAICFFPLDEEDREKARQGMLTLLPGKYGSDGMFFAKIRRKLL